MNCPNCKAQLDAGVLSMYSPIAVGTIKCASCGHSFSADALRQPARRQIVASEREIDPKGVIVGVLMASFAASLIVAIPLRLLWLLVVGIDGPPYIPETAFPMTSWIFAAIPVLIWFFKFEDDRRWPHSIVVWLGGYFVGTVINSFILIMLWPVAWVQFSGIFRWTRGIFLFTGGVLLWLGFKTLRRKPTAA